MMRGVRGLGLRSITALAGALALALAGPAVGRSAAQTPTPAALQVQGAVEGTTQAGGRLTMRADATMPGGWRGVHLVEFQILEGDRELERVGLDVDNNRLVVLDRYVLVGTEAVAVGTYLRVPASGIVITTGGEHLSVAIDAEVHRAIPEDARFRLSATDDAGLTRAVVRRPSAPGSEGFGWGTVLTVAIAAVFIGGFVGNLIASRRRPPPRLSVYGALQRRIDDERSSSGRPR
jgi:hypothetical protein